MKTIWMLALVTLLPVLILDACRASESTSGGSASVSAVVTNENVGEMLVKMEQEWADANVRGDLEFQDRILADDYIGTMEDGSTNTKAQWIDFLRSGTVRLESVDVTGIKVRMFDNVAVVTYNQSEKSQFQGKDYSGQTLWTDLFLKRNGKWQIVAEHGSRVDAPKK